MLFCCSSFSFAVSQCRSGVVVRLLLRAFFESKFPLSSVSSLSLKFLKASDHRVGIGFFNLVKEVCVLFLVGCVFEEANGVSEEGQKKTILW